MSAITSRRYLNHTEEQLRCITNTGIHCNIAPKTAPKTGQITQMGEEYVTILDVNQEKNPNSFLTLFKATVKFTASLEDLSFLNCTTTTENVTLHYLAKDKALSFPVTAATITRYYIQNTNFCMAQLEISSEGKKYKILTTNLATTLSQIVESTLGTKDKENILHVRDNICTEEKA